MNLEHTTPELSGNERYGFTVNGTRYATRDRFETGQDILHKAGFNPPSEHILVQLTRPGSRTVGLREKVDFDEPGREDFRAFRSDRAFTFTVDEVGYEWGAALIAEFDLRDIAGVPDGKALVLERKDEPDEVIEEGSSVDLDARGTEHLRTKKLFVIVTYGDEDREFKLEPRKYTGTELAAIFGVPSGHVLDLVGQDGTFDEIEPGEVIRVKKRMHFVSHPPLGQSS